ncbi:MAG TPA: hypothetical protein VFT42_04655, partial [Solirubrobacteraceae bacterium]|nr:hypothetical protein [Solirubrobacteraceae bacterium]
MSPDRWVQTSSGHGSGHEIAPGAEAEASMEERREIQITGHVFVVQRSGGRQWYVQWRDGEGQHQKRLGPAWVKQSGTDARGRPRWRTADGSKPEGYLSPRDAAAALEEIKRTA